MQSSSGSVEMIRSAVSRLNAGDLDGYLAAFTDDCQRWVPGMPNPLTLGEIRAGLELLAKAFPDSRLEEVLMFGDGRHVCAHWRLVGTHTGDYLGIAPTGAAISVDTAEIYEFQLDGERVRASRAFGDPLVLMQQLTAAAPTERA